MNFETWKTFREQLVACRPNLLRLDCMNPFHALTHVVDKRPYSSPEKSADYSMVSILPKYLADAFTEAFSLPAVPKSRVATLGVRSFLSLFFRTFEPVGRRCVWLPRDVFPAYELFAREYGWSVETFATLPQPNWNSQDPPTAEVALLPVPLSPLGRDLEPHEYEFWIDWLDGDSNRVLLLDTVYAYEPKSCRQLQRLREHRRVICIWSISKTWIERCVFGFAEVDETLRNRFQNKQLPELQFTRDEIDKQLGAAGILVQRPDLPTLQAARFHDQWTKLQPVIQKADPQWQVPKSGYFSTLPANYETLIQEHNLLAVPATVFGSNVQNLSVITCLYDIKSDEKRNLERIESGNIDGHGN